MAAYATRLAKIFHIQHHKGSADLMRWYRFGADFFVCDCEKLKMYWMYIEFFGKKQAGKDVPKMCRRINQRFLNINSDFQR